MESMLLPLRIILCLIVHLPLGSLEFICPGPVDSPQGLSYARIEPNISGRVSQEFEKIRIKLFFDQSIDERLRGLVQEAVDFWSNVLSVKPVDGRIFKSRDCESENYTIYKALDGSNKTEKCCLGSCKNVTQCLDIEVRKEHLDGCKYCNEEGQNFTKDEPDPGTGVENADLVFYASAIHTKKCLNVKPVAYAGACEFEPVLDRPVSAIINICPTEAASFSDDNTAWLRAIKHEMTHALGFGFDTFKLFRDKEGKPLWPRDEKGKPKDLKYFDPNSQRVFAKIPRDWHVRGKVIKSERLFLVTPNVMREARNHFGCPDLEGAEWEDQGSPGTKYYHFEARVFYDEGIKGNLATGNQLFSRLSLAVFEDSGWYHVNYSQAEEMNFGRNLGCGFVLKAASSGWTRRGRRIKALNVIATA